VIRELGESQDAKEQLEEWSWQRCLSIAKHLLQHTRKDLTNGGIAGLEDAVIAPAIQHSSVEVREIAFRTLGIFCLLSQVTIYLPFFTGLKVIEICIKT